MSETLTTTVESGGESFKVAHLPGQTVIPSPFAIFPGYIVTHDYLSPEQVFAFDEALRSRANTESAERMPAAYWGFDARRSFLAKIDIKGVSDSNDPKSFKYPVLMWVNEQTGQVWERNNDPKFWHSRRLSSTGTAEPMEEPVDESLGTSI